jgi:PQQ-like domain
MVTLAALLVPAGASRADSVYWGQSTLPGLIRVGNLDGSGSPQTLFAGESGPTGVAIDPAAGRIYWTNLLPGAIRVGSLDGSGSPQTLFGGESQPAGVAIDPAAGRIYWPDRDGVRVGNLDGSGTPQTLFGGESGTRGVAIDPAAGRIYWANQVLGAIRVGNLDGSGTPQTLFGGVGVPSGVAIDPAAGRIYWANQTAVGAIRVGNLDGSGTAQTLFGGESRAVFPALLRAPAPAGPPTVSGGALVGQQLACGTGSWAPDLLGAFLFRAPRSLSQQWLRDGSEIAGATQATHVPSEPGSYSCRVTATNQAGSSSQTSEATLVASPPSSSPGRPAADPVVEPAIARLRLASRCLRRSRSGRVRVRLSMLLARPGPVQVRIDRGVGSKGRKRCPRPDPRRRFTGRFRHVTTLTRVPARPTAAAVGVQLTLRPRLTPGLYRISVRARLDGERLSPPVRRYLRVLGR